MYMRRAGLRIDVVADVQRNHDVWSWRLTPQLSGGALLYEARRTCIMK
jgi:hypothetical protein